MPRSSHSLSLGYPYPAAPRRPSHAPLFPSLSRPPSAWSSASPAPQSSRPDLPMLGVNVAAFDHDGVDLIPPQGHRGSITMAAYNNFVAVVGTVQRFGIVAHRDWCHQANPLHRDGEALDHLAVQRAQRIRADFDAGNREGFYLLNRIRSAQGDGGHAPAPCRHSAAASLEISTRDIARVSFGPFPAAFKL